MGGFFFFCEKKKPLFWPANQKKKRMGLPNKIKIKKEARFWVFPFFCKTGFFSLLNTTFTGGKKKLKQSPQRKKFKIKKGKIHPHFIFDERKRERKKRKKKPQKNQKLT